MGMNWGAGILIGAAVMAGSVGCAEAQMGGRAAAENEQQVTEVPFRWVKSQRMIEVSIKGQGPFAFLVDTGVSGAAVDLDLASRLGIELPKERESKMDAGAMAGRRIYQTWITDLSVGGLHLDRLQAAALSLEPLSQRLGEPLHGILGDGFLKTRVTRFDDAGQTLSFASSLEAFDGDVAVADYVTPMVISPGGEMPILEVTLGGKSFVATLDMGSSLGLEIFTPFIDEFGLSHAPQEWKEGKVLGGSLGQATVYDGVLKRIDIGPLTFTDVPTSITPPRSDPQRKGNLGNQLWEGYVLILDFVDHRIVFRKP
ncbi:MAG TPA: pepsin/retropepsin-like aspartic protease family protein [Acidobacteriota bacterium]|nr:pepsin/retropepsin-like aspartic protease family protein [Acidobacteriota bacterium]